MTEIINLNTREYRRVGCVYSKDGNDFLICYNSDGLCALNIDGELSNYELFDKGVADDIIRYGKCTFDNMSDYLTGG